MARATSELRIRKLKKKLNLLKRILGSCDDEAFLQLSWAVNMLQSDFGADVSPYIFFPIEAKTTRMDTSYSVHKWDIETLITLLLTTPKIPTRPGFSVRPRCDNFNDMAVAVNALRVVEDREASVYLDGSNILIELHRIGHRQFEWQRGFATSERLYRYIYVYGQGGCANFFKDSYGISIDEFLQVGFLLFAQLHSVPWTGVVAVEKLGISEDKIAKALPLFSCSLAEMREKAKVLVGAVQDKGAARIAYLPSVLRRYPVITAPERRSYMAPLPQLVMFRMTAGLYYDLANGPASLISEANRRFEEYVRVLIGAFFPRFEVLPSQRYGTKKARYESPDVLIKSAGKVIAVVECKATKLTYEAQFADDPIGEANNAYSQLVKGIAQIWKFFSHVRRGLYSEVPISGNAPGILLTMDSWMQMSGDLQRDAIALAKAKFVADPDVIDADMRPIIFCSMQELADIMFVSNEDEFIEALGDATEERFLGWSLREVRREGSGSERARTFPLEFGDLVPWWSKFH